MKRKSTQNNVSDILADSVQIKRKDSELRQQEFARTSCRRAKTTVTLSRTPAYTMNLAMVNALGELLQKI